MQVKWKSFFLAAALFFTFLGVTLVVYRNGIASLPRADQINLMRERQVVHSDWEYLWNNLSINRTGRTVPPGDYFLFRPFFWGFLTVVDIFFRTNFYAIGMTSFIIHSLLCAIFFFLVSRFSSKIGSAILAVLLLTQYPGLEMVFWRSNTPYLIGLLLFCAGFLMLLKFGHKKHFFSVLLMFTIACLFHEGLTGTFLAISLFFILFQEQTTRSKRDWILIFAIPVALYLLFNFLNFLFCKPSGFWGVGDQPKQLTVFNIVSSIAMLAGLFGISFFMPWKVSILFPRYYFQGEWNFYTLPIGFVNMVGAFFILLLALSLWYWGNRIRRKGFQSAPILGAFSSLYLLVLIFEKGIIRVALRSIDYMRQATYDFYFIAFWMLMLIGLFLGEVFERLRGRWPQNALRVVALSVIGVALSVAYLNANRINAALAPRSSEDRFIADLVLKLDRFLVGHPEFCYASSLDNHLVSIVPEFMLYRRSCAAKDGVPVYGLSLGASRVLLKQIDTSALSALQKLQESDFDPNSAVVGNQLGDADTHLMQGASDTPLSRGFKDCIWSLSENEFRVSEIQGRFKNSKFAGIIAGYQDANNYSMVLVDHFQIYALQVQNGLINTETSFSKLWHWDSDDFKISVFEADGRTFILFNDFVILRIQKAAWLQAGRVGWWIDRAEQVPELEIREAAGVSDQQSGIQLTDVTVL